MIDDDDEEVTCFECGIIGDHSETCPNNPENWIYVADYRGGDGPRITREM